MKRLAPIAAVMMLTLSGCAVAPFQSGLLYSSQTIPALAPNQHTECEQKGVSSTANLLGLISVGDAGIDQAKRNGKITRIDSVDVQHMHFLGLFSRTQTVVCGR